MFEFANQSGSHNAISYFTPALVSIFTHVLIFSLMVCLPLIFCSSLNFPNPITWIIDSPVLAQQTPPPPPPAASSTAAKAGAGPDDITYQGELVPPKRIPVGVLPPAEPAGPAELNWLGPGGGLGIPVQEPADGSWVTNLLGTPIPKSPPPKPPAKPELVQAVSELQESKLIFKVDPVYPEIAIRARVSGTVVLGAIIDEEGNVGNLKVLSGHPLLTKAAVEAVRQWKYRPTILNGEPVSVSGTITVVFRIRQP